MQSLDPSHHKQELNVAWGTAADPILKASEVWVEFHNGVAAALQAGPKGL